MKKRIGCFLMAILLAAMCGITAAASYGIPYEEIAQGVYCLNDYGMAYMYLIVGTEKALLIDTGTGVDGLEKRVREITELPLIVAATHGHVDHIGGAGQFDEIYLHPADFSMVQDVTVAYRRLFALWSKISQPSATAGFRLADIRDFGETNTLEMPDGHVFELGGRQVTVTHIPGHTRGSCMFTDSKTDLIIGGDNTGIGILMFFKDSSTMKDYAASIEKVRTALNSREGLYGGHTLAAPLSRERLDGLCSLSAKIASRNPGILKHLPVLLVAVDAENGVLIVYRTDKMA